MSFYLKFTVVILDVGVILTAAHLKTYCCLMVFLRRGMCFKSNLSSRKLLKLII